MRKCSSILALMGAFIFAFSVEAQSLVRLDSASVDIWPEYDRLAVLVIYHISLSSETTLPATITLRVPAQAEVYAVAVADSSGGLINAPYDRSIQGAWATLKISTNSRIVQVEYYDALVKNGLTRQITFEWSGDYAVDSFSVTLQQPVGATQMVTDPDLTNGSVGQDGFVYFRSGIISLAADQPFTLSATYQKETDTLSTTGLAVQPTQPLTKDTPGRVTMSGIIPIVAGITGILILTVVVGGLYFWKNGTRHSSTIRKRNHQRSPIEDTGTIYCHQCGKRAQTGDVFCRTCGMRLQKED